MCVCVHIKMRVLCSCACAIPGTIVDNKMKQLLIARNGRRLYNTRVIGHVEWFVCCCPKRFTPSVDKPSRKFPWEEPSSGHVVSTCLQTFIYWVRSLSPFFFICSMPHHKFGKCGIAEHGLKPWYQREINHFLQKINMIILAAVG